MSRPERPGRRYLGVDIPEELFGALQRYAKANHRTVSSVVRIALADWISQFEFTVETPRTYLDTWRTFASRRDSKPIAELLKETAVNPPTEGESK